jgi:hypothetical protein
MYFWILSAPFRVLSFRLVSLGGGGEVRMTVARNMEFCDINSFFRFTSVSWNFRENRIQLETLLESRPQIISPSVLQKPESSIVDIVAVCIGIKYPKLTALVNEHRTSATLWEKCAVCQRIANTF